ncbi:C_GCAxxG_C_C family protein [bacterium]|nr:C_GCAxxG_C_C family protein [bacterium]
MKKIFSRREFLTLGAAAGGTLLGANIESLNPSSQNKTETPFPWEYRILDVEKTQNRAYKNYFQAGCMYGVFGSVAGQVAEDLGKPYTDFPFILSSYGGGGVAHWGSLCGTCNGAAMAVALFHQGNLRNQLTSEIFAWYEKTELPVYTPQEPVKVEKNFEMKASQSKSTLCHTSVSRWTQASGFSTFSPQRAERCARLVADIAGYTVKLLNQAAKDQFSPQTQMSAVSSVCRGCHGQGKEEAEGKKVISRMNCSVCHPNVHKK